MQEKYGGDGAYEGGGREISACASRAEVAQRQHQQGETDAVAEAMWHVSWVGIIALAYMALRARAVLAQAVTPSRALALVSILLAYVTLAPASVAPA